MLRDREREGEGGRIIEFDVSRPDFLFRLRTRTHREANEKERAKDDVTFRTCVCRSAFLSEGSIRMYIQNMYFYM